MTQETNRSINHLLTSGQAAAVLSCKPQTLRKWRVHGKGPRYIRLGDTPAAPVAYRLADLEAWIAARVFKSTSEETTRKAEQAR